ncbi:MAG: AI-2E family transporter [Alphaproteobacteria bacterium]
MRDDSEATGTAAAVPPGPGVDKVLRGAVVGSFLILLLAALFFGKELLLPVCLAFLLALVLSPIVRALERRGVPEGITAVALVVILLAGIGGAVYGLSGPVSKWVADAPLLASQVQHKVAALRRPVDAVVEASSQVEKMAESSDPTVQRVVLAEPGLLTRAATGAPEVLAKIGLTLVLLLFLLASGDMFFEKLVRVLPTMSDKKRGLRIARKVQREVSRYLFTITLINVALGTVVGVGMWVVGLPNPVLWGIAATVLNFIPYIGSAIGIALVGVIGLVTFDTPGQMLLPPAVYAAATMIEGQIITPLLVGRRLEMNAVAVFLAVAFWGWLWGIVGAIIAVPMLVVAKVFSDHVDGLNGLGEFLGARNVGTDNGDED